MCSSSITLRHLPWPVLWWYSATTYCWGDSQRALEEEAATASQEEPTCDGSVNEKMLTSVSVLCRFTQLLTLYLYPAKVQLNRSSILLWPIPSDWLAKEMIWDEIRMGIGSSSSTCDRKLNYHNWRSRWSFSGRPSSTLPLITMSRWKDRIFAATKYNNTKDDKLVG